MSELKWIKLSIDMFDDEKIKLIESSPEADTILIVWLKLLAQAGKTNVSGYIFLSENIPYTDEMLSTIFNRPLNTVRMALQVLERFGLIKINADTEYIKIVNWEKHQNVDAMDKIREQTRKRVEKHRDKLRLPEPQAVAKVEKKVYGDSDVELQLAKQLFTRMLENNPEAKTPNFQVWADIVRLMIVRDKRKPEQIKNMIDWSQKDTFWQTNILSTKKLRDKYDQLKVKALQDWNKQQNGGASNRQSQNDDVFKNILGGGANESDRISTSDENNNKLL